MIDTGLCRNTINNRIGRCRRFVRWAIQHEHAKPTAILVWQAIEPLKYGRTKARETRPVLSAEHKVVDATPPELNDVVRRMVLLQLAEHSTSRMTSRYIDNTVERVIWAAKQVSLVD